MTHDEVMALPEMVREVLRWDLSSRWRCLGCGEIIYLRVPMVVGHYCCGDCGFAILRPYYYELTAAAVPQPGPDIE